MSIKRFLFPLLLVFSGMALLYRLLRRAYSMSVSPATKVDSSPASFAAIDAFIEREMRRMKMPGLALAIVQEDCIAYQRGFGRARPGGAAPTPQTPFFIGSLTKSITASAVMQLVEAGKVKLDDPVQRYLPWFRVADPQASAQMTVRHLLNQTSGLPELAGEAELADFDDRPDAGERQARALASLKLVHPPGTACAYANMNYNLLGLIMETVTGEPYADTIQKQLFDPLEMRHTYASPALAKQNGLARGHQYWFGIPFAVSDLPSPRGSLPSGQLISSAEDMAHYLIAHLNGGRYGDKQILSSADIDELQRGVLEYRKMGVNAGRYAMGWFAGRIGQTELLWHGGTMPDFGAYMALLPEQKKAVVLLCNADHYWMNPVLAEFGTGVTALLAGERYRPMPLFRIFPGALLCLLLIPALQIAGAAATMRLLQQWRHFPACRPSGRRARSAHVLLPLIPHLLIASTLIPMLSKRRGFLKLFMPDYAWIAMLCGSFALVWGFMRAALVLRALRKSPL